MSRVCSVWRYNLIDATGVFSSWVTALMNASCCSLRRISRTRKIVLSTSPVMMSGKARRPRISMPAARQFGITTACRPPVHDDPADVERQGPRGETAAEDDEEGDRFPAAARRHTSQHRTNGGE